MRQEQKGCMKSNSLILRVVFNNKHDPEEFPFEELNNQIYYLIPSELLNQIDERIVEIDGKDHKILFIKVEHIFIVVIDDGGCGSPKSFSFKDFTYAYDFYENWKIILPCYYRRLRGEI
jgi:hypothetical protein